MSAHRIRLGVLALGLVLGGTSPARAQVADSTTDYFSASPTMLARWSLVPYGDIRVRRDDVRDRPGAADFHRQRLTVRTGLTWAPAGNPLRIEAGVRASLGSDHNRESWSSFDNEVADGFDVDRLMARVSSAAGDGLEIGKMRMPMPLTELLWDGDLRPVGVAVATSFSWTRLEGLTAAAGAFTRSRLDGDDARVLAAQVGFASNPARPGGDVRLSYLAFDELGTGLARQNRVVVTPEGARLAPDFGVLDLQIGGHAHFGRVALTLRLDGAINLATEDDARRAVRTRLAAGGTDAPFGLEGGWIYQRIERDAVPGAFNSDDWWFHSRAQGHSAFVNAGVGRAVSLRIAGFVEKRDNVADATRRLIVELRAGRED
ncbi:MAG TPA: hypothetical protein VEY91_01425 [Candidatus Limnocylindria bacterium]|nr:hypothetical protein [Candidatus Limnocylindria bacterium]